ncbi:MAG TPA: hypothetical protein VID31_09390 [Streptosporangiaceae bacterium]
MPADTMELAYGVIGEIGADVADIRIPGERTRLLHLPGADVLLLAGLTVVSAFFRGLLTGVVAEASQADEDLGRGLVYRFTQLITGSDGDVLTDFRQAAADAEAALTRLGVAAGALGQYAAGAQAEVAAALRSLGLRDERVQILAPATTTRLIGQLHTDLTAT